MSEFSTDKLYLLTSTSHIRMWQGFAEGNTWHTVSGIHGEGYKITTSSKKTILKGKNIGKSNETTPEKQAELTVMSEYNKKIKKGYKTKITDLENIDDTMPFPMALHNIANNWDVIRYPIYIQPKYDGTLFIVSLDKLFGYSRGRKQYDGQIHIIDDIKKYIGQMDSYYLVGELWKHGYNLQNISGASRRMGSKIPILDDSTNLEYWVFDIFNTKKDHPFEHRIKELDNIFEHIPIDSYIKRVPNSIANNRKEADVIYNSYLEDSYEGAVVRMPHSKYEWSFNKEKRVLHSLKWKPRFDSEYEIIDIVDGIGKESGAIIFVLTTQEGLHFKSTPNWEYDIRRTVYSKLISNKELVIGQLAIIEYSNLSQNNIPQQPKMINFRDPDLLRSIL